MLRPELDDEGTAELDMGFGPCAVCGKPSPIVLHTSEGRANLCAGACSKALIALPEADRAQAIRRMREPPKPRPSAPTDPELTLPGGVG